MRRLAEREGAGFRSTLGEVHQIVDIAPATAAAAWVIEPQSDDETLRRGVARAPGEFNVRFREPPAQTDVHCRPTAASEEST
jgi:hypothetical protein